ncbi:MAG TPA: helix-turn-helix transcriptional regulator [Longimicrobium sp.]|nr:helix-turn-helix transcriptional regulator [Longimicrobium sp.]
MTMKLMRTPPITGPDEIRAAREANGWSVEQMADVMWVSPLEVVAWEAGSFPPSRQESGLIRWHAQMAERDRAYGPDGIQPCAWIASQAARDDTPGAHPSNLDWKYLAAHASRCDACRRAAELDAALPPIPSPIEDPATLLWRRIDALPWPYTLAVHSGVAAALAGFAVLLGYAFIWLQDPAESVSLSATPFLVLMSGAEAFVLLDRPLRDTAARHPFLVGYLRTAGVLVTMLVAWLALSGVELFGDAWVWIVTGIVTALLGYAAGEMQEDRNPPSVPSRQ